jgi:hypothetical protein
MEAKMTKVTSMIVEKGRRDTVHHEGGGVSMGPDGVKLYRLLMIKSGMEMEMLGMRLTRKAPPCFTIVKREFGLKGRDKRKVYEAFCAMHGLEAKPAR